MDIENSFSSSLTSSTNMDVGLDIAEIGVDSFFENEILKQIPIVKAFAAITQTGINVHDKLFLKKIFALLTNISTIPAKDRLAVINQINKSKKYRLKVGEKLLYIIDTCNDFEYAERVAVLFKAVLTKKITYSEYLKAANIVATLSKNDLEQFLDWYQSSYRKSTSIEFTHTGLVNSYTNEVEVDVDRIEGGTRLNPVESYSASVSGGDLVYYPSEAGKIVFEVFGIGKEALQAMRRKKSEENIKRMVAETKKRQEKQKLKTQSEKLTD